MLDGLAEDPLLDFAQINSELALFDPELTRKPQVVALNKMDLPDVQERWPQVRAALKDRGGVPPENLFAISAVSGADLHPLLFRAAQLLEEAPELEPQTGNLPVYRKESDPREFSISRTGSGWRVSGVAIERAAGQTYWEYDQSVRRFQRILMTLGVEEALRKAGVKAGDIVFIGDFELEWQD
jgi:GTP-binding protein